ncbi:MAG: hypothetical protein JST31_02855 [Actinobacteria bacterium]|nr:hypothetical protein [Actinomycetota bacterium]
MTTRLIGALAGTCALVALLIASLAPGAFAQGSLPKLSLKLSSSSISAEGSMQSGAVNVVVTNKTKGEASTILFRLNPGVSEEEVMKFLHSKAAQDANAAGAYGAIVLSVESAPGKTVEAQASLAPGEYLALGAPGHGPPKLADRFSVAAAASPMALPKPAATVSAIEFGFRGPTTLKVGQLVRFKNAGYLVHMDIAFPVKSKAAAQDAAKGLRSGNEKGLNKLIAGPPISFTGPVSHGAVQQEKITAKPGWYVQVCFMETQDGVPHTRLGMERVIQIVK